MNNKTSYKFGEVVSAARKEIGLTQYELCKRMGLSQSNLSKIESNQLRPSADVWIEFCEHFSIPVNSYRMGYIDSFEKKRVQEMGGKPVSIELPKKYTENAMLRIRFLIPIIENLKLLFGFEQFEKALNNMHVDNHFVNVRDTLVNFTFLNDLLKNFEFGPSTYEFSKVAEIAAHDFVHGKIWSKLSGLDVVRTTSQFSKRIESYLAGYYIRQETYANSQVKLVIPPFPSRPSFLNDVSLIEQINYTYLPNFIKALVESNAQVQFLDEGPSFQIFIKG